jgi:hypothetical protein
MNQEPSSLAVHKEQLCPGSLQVKEPDRNNRAEEPPGKPVFCSRFHTQLVNNALNKYFFFKFKQNEIAGM